MNALFHSLNSVLELLFFPLREDEQALVRLAQMTRGIGDPLIAAYTRMFVCRMGVAVAPTLTHYIVTSIKDFLHTLTQVQVSVQLDLTSRVTLPTIRINAIKNSVHKHLSSKTMSTSLKNVLEPAS